MVTWHETDDDPTFIYDGLGPDEFTGYPPRSIPRQIAVGAAAMAAGLLVGWIVFHWLAGAVAGGLS